MSEYIVIGKRLPRVDGVVKATGEAEYTVDLVLPRMLHGAILRSPYPHAKILNIDTSRAERLPGVKAVVIGSEVVDAGRIQPALEYGLAIHEVHYYGEGVAAVAAIDRDVAMEALSLIDVVYEELPAVFDPEEALREGAPKANTDLEDNLVGHLIYHWGDVDKGFRESDYMREDRFITQSIHPCYMEPFVSIADFDAKGKLTFWTSTQAPYRIRSAISAKLGINEGDVRVIVPYVGGGHCGKTDYNPADIITAVLSKKSSRPVKMELSRDEVFVENRGVPPTIAELRTGIKKNGRLSAMQCRTIADLGPYARFTAERYGKLNLMHQWLFGMSLNLPYRLPNIKYEGLGVYTNNQFYRSQRGSGITPARFCYESQLDMIAVDLGIDPVEIRRINALQPGDITANKDNITSCGLTECLEKVTKRTNWQRKRSKLGSNRGLGIACYVHPCGDNFGVVGSSAAFVHVQDDGTVVLIAGGTELGQGITTVICQIVAEELGLSLQDIRIAPTDTELCPHFVNCTGSKGTWTVGNAVKAAAADAKRQILELATEKLCAKVEELVMERREIYVKGNSVKRISFATLARDAINSGKPILGKGYHTIEGKLCDLETGEGLAPTYSFGVMVAEVEVNTETGQVKVIRTTMAGDVGFALNPMQVEGQFEGQIQAGLGQAIYEHRLTEKGRVLNPTFTDYRMPRSLDMPQVESIVVETVDPGGPFGAKECGEGPTGAVAPAIANAVYDAIGVRFKELPITPDKVIKALREKEAR